jgi:hypothetical protein
MKARPRSLPAGAAACTALCAAFFCLACDTGGVPAFAGVTEPIRVSGGQFFTGDLPGIAAPDGGADDAGTLPGPQITAVTFNNQLVVPGAAGKSFGGRSKGAASVGIRFADLGTGFWVVPIGDPDGIVPGEDDFGFSADFSANDPAGLRNLLFVGIDSAGNAGEQAALPVCIESRIPDNLHSCLATNAPPDTVITLQWDTGFDVDLHVFTPGGLDINPKAPLGVPIEAGATPDPKAPRIDRDSWGNCTADGLMQEDIVYQTAPPKGAYDIYADPFASCGQAAVRFRLTVYRSMGTCPACSLQSVYTQDGELLGSQATGGASTGLFIHEVAF